MNASNITSSTASPISSDRSAAESTDSAPVNQRDADEFATHMESSPETPEPMAEGPAEGSQEMQSFMESLKELKDSWPKS